MFERDKTYCQTLWDFDYIFFWSYFEVHSSRLKQTWNKDNSFILLLILFHSATKLIDLSHWRFFLFPDVVKIIKSNFYKISLNESGNDIRNIFERAYFALQ